MERLTSRNKFMLGFCIGMAYTLILQRIHAWRQDEQRYVRSRLKSVA